MLAPEPQQYPATELENLVAAARRGDNVAWSALHARFDRTLRAIARSYRLSGSDVDDVSQVAWVRLYEHIDRISDPNALAGWLATTVRREAMRLLQVGVREQLTDCVETVAATASRRPLAAPPESELLAAETRVALTRALASLTGQQRQVLTLLAGRPDASYQEISRELNMPIGSIGPTRARGMARLERHPELRDRRWAVVV